MGYMIGATFIFYEKNELIFLKNKMKNFPQKASVQGNQNFTTPNPANNNGKQRTNTNYNNRYANGNNLILLKAFEEYCDTTLDCEKVDELIAATNGELKRSYILNWFYRQRKMHNICLDRKRPDEGTDRRKIHSQKFPQRINSLLEKAHDENSCYIDGEKLDELVAHLDYALSKTQILSWFKRKRCRTGMARVHTTACSRFPARITSVLNKAFVKNSGFIDVAQAEELAAVLNNELNIHQIRNWFDIKRFRHGIPIHS